MPYSSDDSKRIAGIVSKMGDTETYLYVCGLEIPRAIKISDGIAIEPVNCNPDLDDMISCIMKTGSHLEYDLGVLIATLRCTTTQIHIEGRAGKELAVTAWNTQNSVVSISAILNCFAIWFFQSNTPASTFSSSSEVYIVNRSIVCLPREKRHVSEEECKYIETVLPRLSHLESDKRFQTAENALWASHMNPRPAIRAMILWGGIESLFLIERNIKNTLS